MTTKTKTTKGKANGKAKGKAKGKAEVLLVKPVSKFKYSSITKEYARVEGHTVCYLLWAKILANSTPEVREMLFAHLFLEGTVRAIIPEEIEAVSLRPISHDQLREEIHKAEVFLTDMTPDIHAEIFHKLHLIGAKKG